MKAWWNRYKGSIIGLLIIGIVVTVFLSAIVTRVTYETTLGDMSGDSPINVFAATVTDVGGNFAVSFSPENVGNYFTYAGKIGLGCLVAILLVILTKFTNKGEYKDIEYGSSDWCTDAEAYKVLKQNEGMILAQKKCLPVIPTPPPAKNGNILVIGGSGAGKSASFVIPNAMQMLGSYVFTDPKGELYDTTAGMFEKHGYKVHVINLVEPKCSDGYNPLAHIRGPLDIDTIVKIISKKEGGETKSNDPFWDQTSEALLKAVIYYIMLNRPQEEWSIASCLALVRLGGENEGEDLRNIFMSLPFENPARKAFETIRLGSEKTFSNILVSLAAKLEAFDSQDIVALTSTNTIEFEDLVKEKSVLYFITPSTNDTYNFLMNIFFSQMFDRLYEYADNNGGKLPTPLFLILDEFANIGRIPRFEQVLSTCRSYRLHISIILQNTDQLVAIYDEKVAENIMANCSTHLFLGTPSQKTLESFSKQLGEKTITRDSVSKSTDKDSKFSGRNYSDQAMARALMTPDELRTMDPDDCIILLQAMKPIKAKKYWYFGKGNKPHPRAAEAEACKKDHRDIAEPKRGEFKVTNPYELTSYDDIFTKYADNHEEVEIDTLDNNKETSPKVQETTSHEVRPATPQEVEYDLYAELDKRFMELYGKKNS